jgi:predicted flap endonuclease-1-like 5' DNA nuclease
MTQEMLTILMWAALALSGLMLGFAVLMFVKNKRRGESSPPPEAVRPPAPTSVVSDARPATASAPVESISDAPISDAMSPFLPGPSGAADDLTRIKGIGPKLSTRLAELGVFHFSQIAAWTPEQLAAVDAQLGNFQGRPARDQWQSQAGLLAAGDLKAYERVHGKLGPQA